MLEKIQGRLVVLRDRQEELNKELDRVEAQIDVLQQLVQPSETADIEAAMPACPDEKEVRARMKTVLEKDHKSPLKSVDRLALRKAVMSENEQAGLRPIPKECLKEVKQLIQDIVKSEPPNPFKEVKKGKRAGNIYYKTS